MSDLERTIDGQEVTQVLMIGEDLLPEERDSLSRAIVELLIDAADQKLRITNAAHRRTLAKRILWLIGAES